MFTRRVALVLAAAALLTAQKPEPLPNGYALPNGWRITPVGRSVPTEDMVLHVSPAPDGKAVVALHAGFNPHGLVVINPSTEEVSQRVGLKSAWLGLAWHPSGKKLYVSGGNANGRKPTAAPVYEFGYSEGKLSEQPTAELVDAQTDMARILWSGLAHHPKKDILYAANRGTETTAPGHVVLFDSKTGKLQKRIQVEVNPYDLVLAPDGKTLFVSNWASDSVSVIDTEEERVVGTIPVGDNPNDMELSKDGRLFVSCANDNSVVVIDAKTRVPVERISTALTLQSPEGSTPNALTLDRENAMLFVANADNNNVAVVNVKQTGKSEVLGFIPAGWYPSAVAVIGTKTPKLYIGNSKGLGGYANPRGPHSPLAKDGSKEGLGSVKSLQKGSVQFVALANLRNELKGWTKQVYDNVPYKDEYLARAKAPQTESVIPREVGAGSPIKHVIYIIRENRTYDQVLGDMPKGNGDPRITIFGKAVTPNAHALSDQFVLFDNLYCDGEVSVDGHSWSNSAYATDFNEKLWPITYGGHSKAAPSLAFLPGAGSMW
ncbi:MAG: beta-propeller fold lactonase family protein, partial [Bryobacteraceae bacterium]|nr:beta-propeller fold lactonase family protein [Bryobacteraceae bacterium]